MLALPVGRPHKPWSNLIKMGVLALAYYGLARLGLSLGSLTGNVAPVWPPTGLALAVVVLFGWRLWPGVFVGALLVNGLGDIPLGSALGMAGGNTVEALLGAFLLCRLARFHPSLDRLSDVAALAVLAAAISTAVSATIGVTSLRLGGVIPASATLSSWRVWWVGDALGDLVVAPVLFAWLGGGTTLRRWLEPTAVLVALVTLAHFDLLGQFGYPYLVFPLLIWAALRFSQKGAATATLMISAVAVWRTTNGSGLFAKGPTTEALWKLDAFLAVVALTGLVMAAIVSERNRVNESLREANFDLDARVRQRTKELSRDREALAQAQRVARLGSWEWDMETTTLSWSDELYELYGFEREGVEATFEVFLSRVHADDRDMVERAVTTAYSTQQSFDIEHRIVLPDGDIRWLQGIGQTVVDEAGAAVRMHGTALDITDRKRAEVKFEGLLEAAPDAIVVVDAGGVIRLVNRQTETLFGYGRNELVGQRLEMLMPERFRAGHPRVRQSYFDDPLTRPMGAGLDLAACRKDGTEFPVDISLSPLETEDGTLVSAAIRDVTDRKTTEAAMAHQAMHDSLTGLPNRSLLEDRLSLSLARAQRSGAEVAVLFLDIDRFKVINDSRGHSVGDRLLRAIALRLMKTVQPEDTVARFGGDEFVIVTEVPGEARNPLALGDRVAEALAAPIDLDGTEVAITVSIGMAIAGPGDDAESLLRDADAAMYRAKEAGRDRCLMFDGAMRAGANTRMETESALRSAIERGELGVHYQPVLDLTSLQVVGVEALVRWEHPERGIILPGEFIPVAEETGLIVPLGKFVLREACRQVAEWQTLLPGPTPLSVAVNLSARQLLTPDLPTVVRDALDCAGLDASLLCLEITESVLLDDAESSSRALHALKALGVRIGVDDFGTGYSSLTYLKRFPVDTLKIDKSFVDGVVEGGPRRGDRAIVASIVDLAHAFGLTTVAEGVETAEQLAGLQTLGCEQAQGYYLSRPLSGREVEEWIRSEFVHAESKAKRDRPGDVRRVLLVEDDRSLRTLIRLVLDDQGDFTVVAEAADGREAVALARHFQPDVVLLDLAMPGLGGLEALPLLLAVAPAAKVVVLSGLEPEEVAIRAREQGAAGYIGKPHDPIHLGAELDQLLGALSSDGSQPVRRRSARACRSDRAGLRARP